MWNRELTQTEARTLHELHLAGYKAVDKKHIIHFREIYDFISRFADPAYSENVRLRMSIGEVPRETMKIVNTIGANNLYKYFSMAVVDKKFYRFCEKLINTKRIRSVDYISEGTIVIEPINVEVSTYGGHHE